MVDVSDDVIDATYFRNAGAMRLTVNNVVIDCESHDWLSQYMENHASRAGRDVFLFHMREWLQARDIPCRHSIVWNGWRNIEKWLLCYIAKAMFPICKQLGVSSVFWGEDPVAGH